MFMSCNVTENIYFLKGLKSDTSANFSSVNMLKDKYCESANLKI